MAFNVSHPLMVPEIYFFCDVPKLEIHIVNSLHDLSGCLNYNFGVALPQFGYVCIDTDTDTNL